MTLKAAEDWAADGKQPPGAEAAGFTGRYRAEEQAYVDSHHPSSSAAGTSGKHLAPMHNMCRSTSASFAVQTRLPQGAKVCAGIAQTPGWQRRMAALYQAGAAARSLGRAGPAMGHRAGSRAPCSQQCGQTFSSAAAANARVQRKGTGLSDSKPSSNGTARMPARRRQSAWNDSEPLNADLQQPAGEANRAAGLSARPRLRSVDTLGISATFAECRSRLLRLMQCILSTVKVRPD